MHGLLSNKNIRITIKIIIGLLFNKNIRIPIQVNPGHLKIRKSLPFEKNNKLFEAYKLLRQLINMLLLSDFITLLMHERPY